MIEIDHTALREPEPAQPILASHLLASEKKQRRRFGVWGESIKTGCGEIDDYLLGGGFERGIVVGVSAGGGEGRLISLHLLSSILISHLTQPLTSATPNLANAPKTRATIIDSTGSFPLSLLSKVIKSRILLSRSVSARQAVRTESYGAFRDKEVNAEGVDELVQKCLEMVAISRVFDLEGLWEVLGEVRRDSTQHENLVGGAGEEVMPGNRDEGLRRMEEVGDSEEEEILPDAAQLPAVEGNRPRDMEGFRAEQNDEDGVEIIIVDNMTHIINDLFTRKEKSEAHNLLASLSHAIHTLTHTSNILTILHNSTTPKRPSQTVSTHPPPISNFPSNPVKPALGQIFASFPDLHLLLSHLPKTIQDAERLYGQDGTDLANDIELVRYCVVVEVLKDETPALGRREGLAFGAREQRWAAVEVSGDNDEGMSFVNAFAGKGNMSGV